MNLLNKYKDTINDISNDKCVDAIILFGSYATKNIKPLSDLDLAIIFNKNATEFEKDNILANGTDELDISNFEKLPLSLQYKIFKEGKIVVQKRDLNKLKQFIINQWFEFKPRLNRIYKRKGLLYEK